MIASRNAKRMVTMVLINSDKAVVRDTEDVPTLREVKMARALHLLLKDLHPLDPRNMHIEDLCEEIT